MNRILQLVVNPEGFIFDPTFGEVFTVNQTGIDVLKNLKENKTNRDIALELTSNYPVTHEEAEKDIDDFISHLRTYYLIDT